MYRPKLCRRLDRLRKKLEPLGYDISRSLAVEIPVLGEESKNTVYGERLDLNPTVPKSTGAVGHSARTKRKRGEVEDQKQLKLQFAFIAPLPPSTDILVPGIGKESAAVGKVRGFVVLQGNSLMDATGKAAYRQVSVAGS